jgi:hypothetical protein
MATAQKASSQDTLSANNKITDEAKVVDTRIPTTNAEAAKNANEKPM